MVIFFAELGVAAPAEVVAAVGVSGVVGLAAVDRYVPHVVVTQLVGLALPLQRGASARRTPCRAILPYYTVPISGLSLSLTSTSYPFHHSIPFQPSTPLTRRSPRSGGSGPTRRSGAHRVGKADSAACGWMMSWRHDGHGVAEEREQ